MRIFKELRDFMADVRVFMNTEPATTKTLLEIIERQEKQIDDLHAKFLARTLPELKTYQFPQEVIGREEHDFGSDPDSAGMISDFGKDNK
jgi:hypothetical protein